MRPVLLAFALSLAASVAHAQEPTPATPATPAEPVKEKKLCRSEPQLGSIMQKRTCHTRAEWTAIDKANEVNVENMRNRNSGGGMRAQ